MPSVQCHSLSVWISGHGVRDFWGEDWESVRVIQGEGGGTEGHPGNARHKAIPPSGEFYTFLFCL